MSDRPDVPYYKMGKIECIVYIADQGHMVGFCLGNILKYATRCMSRGAELADLEKIENYARMLREHLDVPTAAAGRGMTQQEIREAALEAEGAEAADCLEPRYADYRNDTVGSVPGLPVIDRTDD